MSTGLIAILDDVVALAKVAAASLDDAASQAARAGTKAVGVVIDDAAVTPRYVVGFASHRELPIVGRIAMGSLKNKLLILLPASLALSYLAPWSITPLLVAGGAFLCYEGADKVLHAVMPHAAQAHEEAAGLAPHDPKSAEETKISGAIKTDFILSAEIMALTLASVATSPVVTQVLVLGIVGLGITMLVYGAVALIVKADDVGVSLARNERPVSTLLGLRAATAGATASFADRTFAPVSRAIGRGLVLGMPTFLRLLALVGTAAMLWVGGGIVVHGLEEFGAAGIAHAIHGASDAAAGFLAPVSGAAGWLVGAALAGVLGLVLGVALIPLVQHVGAPAVRFAKRMFRVARRAEA